MNISLAYITTKNSTEAKKIGKALVESRLAACANILDPMNSIYWWEGKVQENSETVLIVKTKASLTDQLIEKVKELHSYDCPCIVIIPIEKGNKDFLDWINKETL